MEAKCVFSNPVENISPAVKSEKGQLLNNFSPEQKVWMFSCFVINDSQYGLQDIQGNGIMAKTRVGLFAHVSAVSECV